MRRILLLTAVASAGVSCRNPQVDANVAQAMIEVGTTLSEIRQDLGELHNTIDSLRTVAAKQDTIIRNLANLAGLPLPPR